VWNRVGIGIGVHPECVYAENGDFGVTYNHLIRPNNHCSGSSGLYITISLQETYTFLLRLGKRVVPGEMVENGGNEVNSQFLTFRMCLKRTFMLIYAMIPAIA